jgi:mevalonate pyrophosphate decarboxylase
MNKVMEAVDNAERQGFAKFITDKGTNMVVCTQEELDAVIEQSEEEAVNSYCESMSYT